MNHERLISTRIHAFARSSMADVPKGRIDASPKALDNTTDVANADPCTTDWTIAPYNELLEHISKHIPPSQMHKTQLPET